MRYLFVLLAFIFLVFSGCDLFTNEQEKPSIPGKIVFSMPDDTNKENSQIYVMNTDGSDIRQLTYFENDEAAQPSWSPDGEHIVFSTSLNNTSEGMSLYIMNADGSDLHPMKDRPNTNVPVLGSNARWSPDGTKIAYDFCIDCNAFGKNTEIFIYDFETDSVVQITDHPAGDTFPVWSPDGQKLAFVSKRDYYEADTLRFRGDLYTIHIDGSFTERLTETGYARNPLWEPNSDQITFRNSESANGLYQVNGLTKSIQQIKDPFQKNLFLYPVSYSPDGKQLLLKVRDYPFDSFHLLNLQSGEEISIKFEPREFIEADWHYNDNN
tara:strand:- start:765 stop:1736 length:972 start_codon:yes stop_codon:yes gene_type:complete